MTRKTAAKTAVPKIPQPHGGSLNTGGVPGNAGGTGRPPSEVRKAVLEGAAKAVPKLIAHLKSKNPSIVQGAADKLLKYGLGTQRDIKITEDDVRERLEKSIETIRRLAPSALAERILTEMKELWT